jgi:hypothetical protein
MACGDESHSKHH